MSTPPNNQTGMPGHGPLPRAADLSGGRTDPRNSGISGQDRDLLAATAGYSDEELAVVRRFLEEMAAVIERHAHGTA